MSRIKDAFATINTLKLNISEAVVIYTFNNLDPHFWPYHAILSPDTREKENLPTLSELTKTLKDEQMRVSNKNRGPANYICSSKLKKAIASELKE